MGKIIITNEYVDFSQFEEISENITIFLHNPNKLIIQLGHLDGMYAHKTMLNSQYRIYNSVLIKIMNDRKITTGTEFVKIGDTYYQM